MSRKNWIRIGLLVLVVDVAIVLAYAYADEGAQMEAFVNAMTPGEAHSELADQAGTWDYTVSIYNDPNAEPTTMAGRSVKKMIMGGRFLREDLEGEFLGQRFTGLGLTGYDNVTGEWVSVWLDNMGTAIHHYTGQTADDGTKVYTAEMHDPATRKAISTRSVTRVQDRDHHTFESYVKAPDGSEVLQMRVEYVRAAR